MTFPYEGHSTSLQGEDLKPSFADNFAFTVTGTIEVEQPELQGLLDEFEGIFGEPTGLPPRCQRTHKIVLTHGANPVVVRPYRYPHAQKDEIERQCAEMLKQGIIQQSTSPFSYPVLFVSKKISHGGSVLTTEH